MPETDQAPLTLRAFARDLWLCFTTNPSDSEIERWEAVGRRAVELSPLVSEQCRMIFPLTISTAIGCVNGR